MTHPGKTLLSFVDRKDPYVPTGVDGESELGPVLSMLAARRFDGAILFHTPHSEETAEETLAACRERAPGCAVSLVRLAVTDAKDYSQIMGGLAQELLRLGVAVRPGARESGRRSELGEPPFAVCVSSGTAEMRAAWFVLASSGMLRATLLQLGSPAMPLFGPANVKEVALDRSPWQTLRDLVMPQEFFEEPSYALMARMEPLASAPAEGLGDVTAALRSMRAEETADLVLESPPDELDEALAELGIHVGSAVTRSLMEKSALVADTGVPVLVTGETGTGKELVALLVHRLSARRGRPFVAVNCGTLQQLAESLLFGHRKGSFTGADKDHKGFFEQAHGGTLFLDEVGELPPAAQASLLRVLQFQEVQPLGATKPVRVDVRVVAATNRKLPEEVAKGQFRSDLYYRLEVGVLPVKPLRERRSEIVPLALRMLAGANQRLARQRTLTKEALLRLERHEWPGNVRELENTIERSVLFSTQAALGAEDLLIGGLAVAADDGLAGLPSPREGFSVEEYLSRARRQLFLRALLAANGNQAQAAKLLGVSKQAVHAFQKGEGKAD